MQSSDEKFNPFLASEACNAMLRTVTSCPGDVLMLSESNIRVLKRRTLVSSDFLAVVISLTLRAVWFGHESALIHIMFEPIISKLVFAFCNSDGWGSTYARGFLRGIGVRLPKILRPDRVIELAAHDKNRTVRYFKATARDFNSQRRISIRVNDWMDYCDEKTNSHLVKTHYLVTCGLGQFRHRMGDQIVAMGVDDRRERTMIAMKLIQSGSGKIWHYVLYERVLWCSFYVPVPIVHFEMMNGHMEVPIPMQIGYYACNSMFDRGYDAMSQFRGGIFIVPHKTCTSCSRGRFVLFRAMCVDCCMSLISRNDPGLSFVVRRISDLLKKRFELVMGPKKTYEETEWIVDFRKLEATINANDSTVDIVWEDRVSGLIAARNKFDRVEQCLLE